MTLLGDVIKQYRLDGHPVGTPVAGAYEPISIREFARRAGLAHTQISRIEDGSVTRPSGEVLDKLSRAANKQPCLLRIVAGDITGEDARTELLPIFYRGAELAGDWGEWCHTPWEEALRIVHRASSTQQELALLAADAFIAGENFETLWEPEIDDVPNVEGPGQEPLRSLLATWRFLAPSRREQLLDYAKTLQRLQQLEYLADADEARLDAATIPASKPDRDRGVSPPFTKSHLEDLGFEGFERIVGLTLTPTYIPDRPGVYAVLRLRSDEPEFLERSVGGHFKGNDPTVPTSRLITEWVPGAATLYIGRSRNLRQRIGLLARYGGGAPVGHQGGRLLWQLADHADLVVAWCETADPTGLEADLIGDFSRAYNALPFANLNKPGAQTA